MNKKNMQISARVVFMLQWSLLQVLFISPLYSQTCYNVSNLSKGVCYTITSTLCAASPANNTLLTDDFFGVYYTDNGTTSSGTGGTFPTNLVGYAPRLGAPSVINDDNGSGANNLMLELNESLEFKFNGVAGVTYTIGGIIRTVNGGTANIKYSIYDSTGAELSSTILTGSSTKNGGSAGWNTYSLNITVPSCGKYFYVISHNGGSAVRIGQIVLKVASGGGTAATTTTNTYSMQPNGTYTSAGNPTYVSQAALLAAGGVSTSCGLGFVTSGIYKNTTGTTWYDPNGILIVDSNVLASLINAKANNVLSSTPCPPDTDGDGLANNIDIDDDNDGIPDVIEDNCTPLFPPLDAGSKAEQKVPPGWYITQSSPDIADVAGHVYGTWNSGCVGVAPAAPNGHTRWVFVSAPTGEAFKTTISGLIPGKQYTFTYYCGKFGGFGYPVGQHTLKMGTTTIDQYTPTVGCGWDTRVITFTPTSTSHDFTFQSTGAGNVGANISVSENAITKLVCDFDNDGIPNSLDLDSDGDGCSDAIEAGSSSTASSTSVYPTGTDVNGNGLLNIYEGTMAGSINYNSMYDINALNSSVNGCLDKDGDGVNNLKDIDDDNDGVLDAIESPSCFYSSSEWFSGVRSNITVTTGCSMAAPDNIPAGLVDGLTAATVRFAPETMAGRQIFEFDFKQPIQLSNIYLGYVSTATLFAAGTKIVLRGSNDGNFWTELSQELAYSSTTATYGSLTIPSLIGNNYNNIFTVTQNANRYRYYDLYWTSGGGVVLGGWVNEVYFETASNYNPSQQPKVASCNEDTDNDGIANHLDLNSDADSCFDAVEAGVLNSSATGIIAGPYGANGFADYYETSSESGVYKNIYEYLNAKDKSINACIDSDGDGIPNAKDLDDDNDGVLDEVECPAPGVQPVTARFDLVNGSKQTQFFSGVFPDEVFIDVWRMDNNLNLKINNVNIVSSVDELDFSQSSAYTNTTVTKVTLPDGRYLQNGIPWNYLNNRKLPLIRISISKFGDVKIYGYDELGDGAYHEMVLRNSIATFQKVPINLVGSNKIELGQSNEYPPTFLNGQINLFDPSGSCDYDNDGIPNTLDLDSDNDGCKDAVEAGVLSTSSTGVVVAPYGANGFADQYESFDESGLYKNNYSYEYDIDSTINACKDTDADGVKDLVDIDDDNDGILDAVESERCFYTFIEAAVPDSITTELKPYLSTSNAYAVSNAIDNNAASLSAFENNQEWLNTEIFKLYAKGFIAITGVKFDLNSWALSLGTTSTFKLQGSTDNVLWTDLSATMSSSATSGSLIVNNTLAPSVKFKYYRLYGVTGYCAVGGVSNISFNLASSVFSSTLPTKGICVSDIDNDGIVNHLDLDSDADSCSDAIEAASSSTATSLSIFPTGVDANSNGLLNVYESLVAGTVNYTSTYSPNSIVKQINACKDSDGDGVKDIIDLDDDNDGILDTDEQTCVVANSSKNLYGPTYWSTASWTGGHYLASYPSGSPNLYIDGDLTNGVDVFRPGTLANPISGEDFTNTPIIFTLTTKFPLSANGFSIVNESGVLGDGIKEVDIKIYGKTGLSEVLLGIEHIDNIISSTITLSYPFSRLYSNISKIQVIVYKKDPAVGAQADNGMQMGEMGLYVDNSFCGDFDTDNDGIPNRLDLDSDGDGCSDAYEAGS